MFYDLNVPYSPTDKQLPRTLAFLHELGYNVIALNHTITGKLPAQITSAIPTPLPPHQSPNPSPRLLHRCTLTLTHTHQNARLTQLSHHYDLLALQPVDEKTLSLACTSLDCDIITLDLTVRYPFYFKKKMLMEAIKAGKRIEICYGQALGGSNSSGGGGEGRRNVIANATQIVRATKGKGVVICSGGEGGVLGLRGPWDVVNLGIMWGLGQERGYEGVGGEGGRCVVQAGLRRRGYRGVVDVVYGGEKPSDVREEGGKEGEGKKRKVQEVEDGEKPLSKTQMKKRAKLAAQQQAKKDSDAKS